MSDIVDHDAYIAAAPEAFRSELTRLRTLLSEALPEAEEMVAYGLPGFAIGGKVVASYAAFSKQCGIYFLAQALALHSGELDAAGFKHTKTGITFPPSKPLPPVLIVAMARSSASALNAPGT